jgi:hypothetical protein
MLQRNPLVRQRFGVDIFLDDAVMACYVFWSTVFRRFIVCYFSQTVGGAKLVFASVSLFHGTAGRPAQMRGAFGFFILR